MNAERGPNKYWSMEHVVSSRLSTPRRGSLRRASMLARVVTKSFDITPRVSSSPRANANRAVAVRRVSLSSRLRANVVSLARRAAKRGTTGRAESDDVAETKEREAAVESSSWSEPGAGGEIDAAKVMSASEGDSARATSDGDAIAEMTRVLQTSLSPRAAAIIAKGFIDLGITDPRSLRQVVAKRSIILIGMELLYFFFNAALASSLFALAVIVHYSGYEILLPTSMNYIAGFCVLIGASIFAVEALAHAIITAVYVYSTIRFETTNLSKFVQALRRIGDDDHILGVSPPFSSIQRASSLVHVVNILNSLRDALHSEAEVIEAHGKHKSTLHNLAAYFEYSNAQAKFGFKPEDYGMDTKEAMTLAALFSEWDTDGTGTLHTSELRRLLTALGDQAVTDIDVKMAMRILDQNETGEVDFAEFVKWYKQGVNIPALASVKEKDVADETLEDVDPNARVDELS